MIQDPLNPTNLVYYDWEITGPGSNPASTSARPRVRSSALRSFLGFRQRRPATIPGPGLHSATIISHNAPDQLTFLRISTLGFTAPELHLLADWLESPRFPFALHSLPVSPGTSSGTMPAAPP